MKRKFPYYLATVLAIFISFDCYCQSVFPPCQGDEKSSWNYCYGKGLLPNGDNYIGEWNAGKPDGQGTLVSSNGKNKYIGKFLDGVFSGQGLMDYESGGRHIGSWKFGKPDGEGTHTWTDGRRYVGNWINGTMTGKGVLTYPDGNTYRGEFKDGKRHGQGIFSNFGNPLQGNWIVDKFSNNVSQVQIVSSNNSELVKLDHERMALAAQKEELELERRKFTDLQKSNLTNSSSSQVMSKAELEKIRREADEAFKKQAIAEAQLKLAMSNNRQREDKVTDSSAVMTSFANRRALVIGNDSYKSVAKLENAREDARTIAANLSSVGYQVTLKLDLTEKEMKASLRTFASQVEGGDEVMFFFAGHGVQLGATNYLLPTDIGGESEAQVRDEAIQLQRILDDMSDRKAKFTLAMIDACRDNPFKSSGRAIGGRGLAPTTAATGQMVIFSAGTGQQALDKLNNADKNKNGLFTRVFVQEMQKPSQSIDRVVKNVRNQVAELAKSVGHEQVPAIYDQVLGDFYFKK